MTDGENGKLNDDKQNLNGDERKDEELVELFQKGDKAAGDEILSRYIGKVRSAARKFFLLGGETEDLVQEGMFGLYSAMISYNRGTSSFATYANVCIKHRILDTVKAAGSGKHTPLNNFLPIFDVGDNEALSANPEDRVLDDEAEKEFFVAIKKVLSPFEYKVMLKYIEGYSITQIAVIYNKSNKSIDNAIMRAKRKLQKYFKAEE
jgi:RNA polymerase sporulation-specific sigma factor